MRNDLAVQQSISQETEETELANKLVNRRGSTAIKFP